MLVQFSSSPNKKMDSEEVVISFENGVRIIRLNRPRRKNAFNSNVYKIVTKTLNNDAEDDKVIVTIITGTGDYYSSGADISGTSNGMSEIRSMIKAFISFPKLLIAVVNGPAIGIAVTTLGLCDVVYASDRATFETPFLRLGLCAEGCSSYTFPRILGRSKSSEMLLLGKKITAKEAYQFNFVSEVIPHEKLEEFTNKLKSLGKLSVNSVKVNKKLILENFENTLCKCCDNELQQVDKCFMSEEFSQAMINFMSRRSKL